MIKIKDFFQTDFGAMTTSDWVGLTMTIVFFVLMLTAYAYVLNPKNAKRLNSYGDIPMNDDRLERGGE
ncbi:MAG: cbb3-type cytochrome c oxidase subunit 3 [Nitrospinota bacterium]|nr:cbb3-type cytochrome c oxidase subunit 3 [Nitrospinota bacterium]